MKSRLVSKSFLKLLVTIAGQVLILVAFYLLAIQLKYNWRQIAPNIVNLQIGPTLGAIFLTFVQLILMPYGWRCALQIAGVPISFRSTFILYYRTSILRYLPGSVWYLPGRAYLSQKQGISPLVFTQSALLELFFLLATGTALAAWAVASHFGKPSILAVSVIAVGAIIFAIAWPKYFFSILFLKKMPVSLYTVNRAVLIRMFLIYVVLWCSYGLAIYLLIRALAGGRSPGALEVITESSAAWAAGFFSPSPTGLGIRELGFSLLLGPELGSVAVIASLTERVIELFLDGLLWLIAKLLPSL